MLVITVLGLFAYLSESEKDILVISFFVAPFLILPIAASIKNLYLYLNSPEYAAKCAQRRYERQLAFQRQREAEQARRRREQERRDEAARKKRRAQEEAQERRAEAKRRLERQAARKHLAAFYNANEKWLALIVPASLITAFFRSSMTEDHSPTQLWQIARDKIDELQKIVMEERARRHQKDEALRKDAMETARKKQEEERRQKEQEVRKKRSPLSPINPSDI